MRPALELADIVRAHGEAFRHAHAASLAPGQKRVLRAIELCRTAELGGHLERCDQCQHERNAYNSCANRHCPKCQSLARAEWLEKRQAELLPAPYFHIVFTLPESLVALALQNKRELYGLLFRATAETLQPIAADPNTSGRKSAFSASCTLGGRLSPLTPICIVWRPVAESPWMAAVGWPAAAQTSSYPYASSRIASETSTSVTYSNPMRPGKCKSTET